MNHIMTANNRRKERLRNLVASQELYSHVCEQEVSFEKGAMNAEGVPREKHWWFVLDFQALPDLRDHYGNRCIQQEPESSAS